MWWLLVTLAALCQQSLADDCSACVLFNQQIRSLKGQDYSAVYNAANASLRQFTPQDRALLTNVLQYNFRKLYFDANDGANGTTVQTSCADLGYCPFLEEFDPPFSVVNDQASFWDEHSQVKNTRDKTIIVLHHTVDPTLQTTIDALQRSGLSVTYIVDVDGKIYQLVRDYRRAWHAGAGIWRGDGCNIDDTNTRSVGIETVNHGDQPFPAAQVQGIHKLISYLQTKWHVSPQNIIAHHENSPDVKYDISGYFSWKNLYDELGFYKDLWPTKLTPEQQKTVVINASIHDDSVLKYVQKMLYDHGYGTIKVGDPYAKTTNPNSKVTTAEAVQSFNRKFCPEIFYKETIENGNEVVNPLNQQVYALTLERLKWFAANQNQENCVNY